MVEITAISATDALITEAFALRHEMFVIEQGVPQELEVDDDDKIATHLAAFSQGRVVGTLRIVLHGCTAKIGRMAVSTSLRKNSIGCGLMEFAALTTSRGGQSFSRAGLCTRLLRTTWLHARRPSIRRCRKSRTWRCERIWANLPNNRLLPRTGALEHQQRAAKTHVATRPSLPFKLDYWSPFQGGSERKALTSRPSGPDLVSLRYK